MAKIEMDASKLLGFRLAHASASSAKIGSKPLTAAMDAKIGLKPGMAMSAKIGAKIGGKPPVQL